MKAKAIRAKGNAAASIATAGIKNKGGTPRAAEEQELVSPRSMARDSSANHGPSSARSGDGETPRSVASAETPRNKQDDNFTFEQIHTMCKVMQRNIPSRFVPSYNAGSTAYMDGNWDKAKECFDQCLLCAGFENDKATKLLLKIMGEYSYKSPTSWAGYRMLSSK